MKRTRIPLADLTIGPATRRKVSATLNSTWLSTGPNVRAFEEAVAGMLGVKYAVALSSATSGLFLAMKGMGIGPDDEVITTPYTFIATIETILHCGARPVFVDVDPLTLTMDPDSLARRISRQTRLVLPIDLGGCPCDYRRLRGICRQFKVPILADAAHAIGAESRGRSIARVADAAVYSFYATKNLTCGEGGMVVSKDRKLIDTVRLLSRHGMNSNAFLRHQSGGWEYDIDLLGYKANMSDLHAAVGLGQLSTFKRDQKRRAEIARRYAENLRGLDPVVELPAARPGDTHCWHLYIIKLDLTRLSLTRDQFIRKMGDYGIECGVHYKPAFEYSYYRRNGFDQRVTPVTASVWKRVVSLPMFAGLTNGQVDRISDAIRRIIRQSAR